MGKRPPQQPEPKAPAKSDEVFKPGTPQDVTSVRAKNTGHKKKTADKWNQ